MGDAGEEAPGATPVVSRAHVGGRNLPMAIAVGVVLAGSFLGSLFWHPAAFTALVTSLVLLASVEAGRTLRPIGLQLQVPVLVVSALVLLGGAYRAGHAGQAVGVTVLFLGAVLWALTDGDRTDVVRTIATTVMFGLWIGFLASFAALLVNRPEGGAEAVLVVAGAAIFSDIGGYAFGVAFGRHKVAPSISPNKTWEGLLGGLLVAVTLAALTLPRLGELFTWETAAIVAFVCGLAAFVGDLVESMIKRDLGVKDLGELLPGHGGMLDRVDGILLALPVGFFAVEAVARMA